MNPETIKELLHRRPFEPFELHMSSGEVHQVRHPEFVMLTGTRLVLVDPALDRVSILALLHIAEVRMLQAA